VAAKSFHLPIDDALPALRQALAGRNSAVLVAPPGAGKTTRVPLALLEEGWRGDGKILVLEPRRLAARAAAERMASTLDEKVGETVGLRVRLETRVSAKTRIEVITEGIFTRLIADDPELSGIAAVLLDEFHERSLDTDLGLALALDAQQGLRDDLRVLVMSATLDGARVAALLEGASVIESHGRSFPVETRHRPRKPQGRLEDEVASAVRAALAGDEGSLLVFLPGQAEIRRTAERLENLGPGIELVQLHGGLESRAQDRAIRPAPAGERKVVLATSIAETSLTIEGVRVVVDCGLSRVPVFEPAVGLTRLETVKVSRASADQRRGRAGRTEPGICYRLWEAAATVSLPAYATPEILSADLSSLALDLASWGVTDAGQLRWLDPPPAPALAEARRLLQELGALDADLRITPRGEALRRLALPPRLAAMVVAAAPLGAASLAAEIAAVLTERGAGGNAVDLEEQLRQFRRDRSPRAQALRRLAEGWARQAGGDAGGGRESADIGVGEVLAFAYPDRVAQARGKAGDFRLANGRGASLDPAESLSREPFLVVADLTGAAGAARIRLAAAITREEIEEASAGRITHSVETAFDADSASVRSRATRRLDALVLADAPQPVPRDEETARILAEGVAALGLERLPWSKALSQWRARVRFLRAAEGEEWPDLSDAALSATAADWLAPHLLGKTALSEISASDLDAALKALLPYNLARRLEQEAPTHFTAPSGQSHPIDYDGEAPALFIRVQELFGLDRHPSIAKDRLPLVLHLLSPAHRPVQVTRDLPAFWRGSWGAVRAEMRGRYPKHPWPDDPLQAPPTHRAKPRGT